MKQLLLLALFVGLIFTQGSDDPDDICRSVNSALVGTFAADCQSDITFLAAVMIADNESPLLRVAANCSVSCNVTFNAMKRFSACAEFINDAALVTVNADVRIRLEIMKALDARCTAVGRIDPPRVKIIGGQRRPDPCPPPKRSLIKAGIGFVLNNCSGVDERNMTSLNCTETCARALVAVQGGLHDCRDEHRFLDEVLHPVIRRRFRVINAVCELRKRLANTVEDCRQFYVRAYDEIRTNCGGLNQTNPTCTAQCKLFLRKSIGIVERCGSIFIQANGSINLPPFDRPVRDFLRKARFYCAVSSRKVDVVVHPNETSVEVTSEDSLTVNRPRTRLRFIAGRVFEWISERFDNFGDSTHSKRFRMRLRRIVEMRPRVNAESDSDFQMYGADPTKDNYTSTYDLESNNEVDAEAIVDLGSRDIYEQGGNASGWRRCFQNGIRFGANRLSRIVISSIVTNIKNGVNDTQVTVPGGVSFNFQFENFPFKSNNTSPVIEFDVDTDVDEGNVSTNGSAVETDTENGIALEDNTEGQVTYGDTRRIRWKRRVYCEDGKEVTVRARFVRVTGETPSGGFTVRKRLIITFHIDRSTRCSRIFWDPTNDVETPPDNYVEPSNTNTQMSTGMTMTATRTDTSNVGKLAVAFLLSIIALFI